MKGRAAAAPAVVALLAVLAPSAPRAAAGTGRLVPDPRVFLRAEGGFSARDVDAVGAGRVVAKVVDTGDNSEVMSVAATRVTAGVGAAFELMKRFEGRRRPGEIVQVGLFDGGDAAANLEKLLVGVGRGAA